MEKKIQNSASLCGASCFTRFYEIDEVKKLRRKCKFIEDLHFLRSGVYLADDCPGVLWVVPMKQGKKSESE